LALIHYELGGEAKSPSIRVNTYMPAGVTVLDGLFHCVTRCKDE